MKFLLDTVVLSEARKPRRDINVGRWLASIDMSDLFVSVASITEIQRGSTMAARPDPVFSAALERWLGDIVGRYGDHVLPIDVNIARRWGALSAALRRRDLDVVIAATAIEHNFVVATRNTSDFLPAGVPVLNPFDPNPTVVGPTL